MLLGSELCILREKVKPFSTGKTKLFGNWCNARDIKHKEKHKSAGVLEHGKSPTIDTGVKHG